MMILIMGVGTALAAFAGMAVKRRSKPKRADKLEKAEIIKQLLAKSDREDNLSAIATPAGRGPRLEPTFATGAEPGRKRTPREQNFKPRHSSVSHSSVSHPHLMSTGKQPDAEIEEQIRQRAYELYQERGGVAGNATDDWQQATHEVLSLKAKAGSSPS
jgi:hypothetical protein